MVVARRGQNLDDALADLDDGNVERASAQVVDHDLLRIAVVEPVGERGARRLVDDAQHVEPRDAARVLRRLALRVIEVGGHGDDRLRHGVPQKRLGVAAELAQDHRREFLRGEVLAVDRSVPVGSHVALDRGNRAVGVDGRLPDRRAADQTLAVFGERHDARRGAVALGVVDDGGLASLHHRSATVRRAQVDSDCCRHFHSPSERKLPSCRKRKASQGSQVAEESANAVLASADGVKRFRRVLSVREKSLERQLCRQNHAQRRPIAAAGKPPQPYIPMNPKRITC